VVTTDSLATVHSRSSKQIGKRERDSKLIWKRNQDRHVSRKCLGVHFKRFAYDIDNPQHNNTVSNRWSLLSRTCIGTCMTLSGPVFSYNYCIMYLA
jgi:hypothetical protein